MKKAVLFIKNNEPDPAKKKSIVSQFNKMDWPKLIRVSMRGVSMRGVSMREVFFSRKSMIGPHVDKKDVWENDLC